MAAEFPGWDELTESSSPPISPPPYSHPDEQPRWPPLGHVLSPFNTSLWIKAQEVYLKESLHWEEEMCDEVVYEVAHGGLTLTKRTAFLASHKFQTAWCKSTRDAEMTFGKAWILRFLFGVWECSKQPWFPPIARTYDIMRRAASGKAVPPQRALRLLRSEDVVDLELTYEFPDLTHSQMAKRSAPSTTPRPPYKEADSLHEIRKANFIKFVQVENSNLALRNRIDDLEEEIGQIVSHQDLEQRLGDMRWEIDQAKEDFEEACKHIDEAKDKMLQVYRAFKQSKRENRALTSLITKRSTDKATNRSRYRIRVQRRKVIIRDEESS